MKSVKLALAGFTATLVCGVALSLAMVAPAAAYPDGWTFECRGTIGRYSGPNGSFITVPNHYRCATP